MMRVLIADHQPLFREGLCAIVSQISARSGCTLECEEVNTLADFMQCLDGEESIDAAILDLSLLNGYGMSGILAIRDRLAHAPLIVLSPANDAETAQLCMTCGVSGYLHRTAHRQDILGALQKVFDGGRHLPAFADSVNDFGFAQLGHRKPDEDQEHGSLSLRQVAVLNLVREGKSNKQIAWELSISETTVKAHMTAILRKLGVNSRAQAIVLLQQRRLRDGFSQLGRSAGRVPLPAMG